MVSDASRDQLLRLLAWHLDAGVDCAVLDEPVDWMDAGHAPGADFSWPDSDKQQPSQTAVRAPAPTRPSPAGLGAPAGGASVRSEPALSGRPSQAPRGRSEPARTTPQRFAAPAANVAEADAKRLAASSQDLAALVAAISRFEGCGLKATATNTCVYRGAERASLMIIGEAPGRDEDLAGRPFVGRAGQLLDRMLAAIDLGESDVHITNVVYWRPPGNRTPTTEETLICRPFLIRQVELVAPDVVLLLGGAAAKAVLDTQEGIMRIRGKWREAAFGDYRVRALATLHPAYLLRTPAAKRQAWRDLLMLKTLSQTS